MAKILIQGKLNIDHGKLFLSPNTTNFELLPEDLTRVETGGLNMAISEIAWSNLIVTPTFIPTTSVDLIYIGNLLTVQINHVEPAAVIYYTIDGSTPTTNSLQINQGEYVNISLPVTIKAIAVANAIQSEVAEVMYTNTISSPSAEQSNISMSFNTIEWISMAPVSLTATNEQPNITMNFNQIEWVELTAVPISATDESANITMSFNTIEWVDVEQIIS